MPKKPCRQRPSIATRSFNTNKFSTRFATHGDTENNSPVSDISTVQRGSCQAKNSTLEMPPLFDDPRRWTVETVIVSRREINDREKEPVSRLDPNRAAPL
jgi:hypothetical protein